MKEFIKKHPALADVCDVILSLLCGSFALLAFGIVWILEKLADAAAGTGGKVADMKEIVIYVHGKAARRRKPGITGRCSRTRKSSASITARRARGRPKPNSRRFSQRSGSAVTASR